MRIEAAGQNPYGNTFGNRYDEQRKRTERAYQQTLAYAAIPDRDLYRIAEIDASKDDKYRAKSILPLLLAIPAADTFISSVAADGKFLTLPQISKDGKNIELLVGMSPGRLSRKLGKFASSAAGWSAALGGAVVYNTALNKVSEVSPAYRKFRQNHPVLDMFLNLLGFGAVLLGAFNLWNNAGSLISKKLPGTAEEVVNKLRSLGEKIDNSGFNKKVIEPLGENISKQASKHPAAALGVIAAAGLTIPIIVISSLFKIAMDKKEKKEKVEDTYRHLLAGRQTCRKEIQQLVNGQIQEAVAKQANIEAEKAFDEACKIIIAKSIAKTMREETAQEESPKASGENARIAGTKSDTPDVHGTSNA